MPAKLLALSLLVAALLAPSVATAADRAIAVNGSITQKVPNDSAGVGFSVSKERKSRAGALSAVAQTLRSVIAAAQTIPGVGPGDITTGRISIRKVSSPGKALYRANEGISVILHQPENAGNLISAAVTAGATGSSGPNFFVGDSTVAYNQALAAAFAQARERAVVLAAQAGATLGAVITIEEGGGVSTVEPVNATSPSASCGSALQTGPVTAPVAKRCTTTPPVKPGTSTVTASVHVVFALQ